MSKVETVKVKRKSDDVECIINKSDFNEKLHVSMEADTNGDGKLTVPEIKDRLDALGIEYKANDRKEVLVELLEAAEAEQ